MCKDNEKKKQCPDGVFIARQLQILLHLHPFITYQHLFVWTSPDSSINYALVNDALSFISSILCSQSSFGYLLFLIFFLFFFFSYKIYVVVNQHWCKTSEVFMKWMKTSSYNFFLTIKAEKGPVTKKTRYVNLYVYMQQIISISSQSVSRDWSFIIN